MASYINVENGELNAAILFDRDPLRVIKFPTTVDIDEVPLSGE